MGVRTPGTELPERADRIRAALEERGARIVEAADQPLDALTRVHDEALVDHLAGAWERLGRGGPSRRPWPGPRGPVPVPAPQPVLGGRAARLTTSITGAAGQFGYDTMTLIGPGTWEAARAALDAAVTAADLVLDGARPRTPARARPATT